MSEVKVPKSTNTRTSISYCKVKFWTKLPWRPSGGGSSSTPPPLSSHCDCQRLGLVDGNYQREPDFYDKTRDPLGTVWVIDE